MAASGNEALLADLLEFLAVAPRSYREMMESWRTSCPRLPVWEDAVDLGLIERRTASGQMQVALTAQGRDWLARWRAPG